MDREVNRHKLCISQFWKNELNLFTFEYECGFTYRTLYLSDLENQFICFAVKNQSWVMSKILLLVLLEGVAGLLLLLILKRVIMAFFNKK